jgi:hypothetical protein
MGTGSSFMMMGKAVKGPPLRQATNAVPRSPHELEKKTPPAAAYATAGDA